MTTCLLAWNPEKWDWNTLDDDIASVKSKGALKDCWSVGRIKKLTPGDRFFMVKLGPEPRGLMASGTITSPPTSDRHFSDPKKQTNYVSIEFDVLSKAPIISMAELKEHRVLSTYKWSPRQSGVTIRDDLVSILQSLWEQRAGARMRSQANSSLVPLGEEEFDSQAEDEGHAISMLVNSFERDPKLRKACAGLHGYECKVCKQRLSDRYGKIAQHLIHVHHLRPLSGIGKRHKVDPGTDLVPVCPNCHAVIHLRKPPYAVEDVQAFLRGWGSGKHASSPRRR